MSRQRGRSVASRWAGRCVALILLSTLSIACAAADVDSGDDLVDAYGKVVAWFVRSSDPDAGRPVVFVEPRVEGFDIDLELQAGIVSDIAEDADVRFIDVRSEALDGDDQIRDGGRLLALGPAGVDGVVAVIDVDEIDGAGETTPWRFEFRRVDDGWAITGPPTHDRP